MKTYYELDGWIDTRKLVVDVYNATKRFPNEELYSPVNQIRSSAISIPSNIAEGCGRQTAKQAVSFLYISRGSLYELETQLFLSNDLGFLIEESLNSLLKKIETCKKLINGFIKYYKKL